RKGLGFLPRCRLPAGVSRAAQCYSQCIALSPKATVIVASSCITRSRTDGVEEFLLPISNILTLLTSDFRCHWALLASYDQSTRAQYTSRVCKQCRFSIPAKSHVGK